MATCSGRIPRTEETGGLQSQAGVPEWTCLEGLSMSTEGRKEEGCKEGGGEGGECEEGTLSYA